MDLGEAQLRGVTLRVRGRGNQVVLGAGVRLANVVIEIVGEGNELRFGAGVSFKQSGLVTVRGEACELNVGRETSFEQARLNVGERGHHLRIGEDCMFAYDVEVRTTDGHALLDARTSERINEARSVEIGDHVWVAAHTLVLKGVTLGDGAVVAAGAVVARSVPAGCVVGGNPAKVLREDVTWSRRL